VISAIAVSSDGLLIAVSSGVEGADAARLGAISTAMLSLANGVGECHPIGTPDKIVIELTNGYLLVCTISVGCSLGVLASKRASLGSLAYEMAIFANRAGPILTPQLIEELKLTVRT
jgi:predicted regulator of Ras-like GTPase activity (Roadblock/LC7/MglB family)